MQEKLIGPENRGGAENFAKSIDKINICPSEKSSWGEEEGETHAIRHQFHDYFRIVYRIPPYRISRSRHKIIFASFYKSLPPLAPKIFKCNVIRSHSWYMTRVTRSRGRASRSVSRTIFQLAQLHEDYGIGSVRSREKRSTEMWETEARRG